jgi:hypothetical protein
MLSIFDTFQQMFGQFAEETLGSPMLIGILIFMFIFFFAMVLLIPFEALVVIMIPTCFLVAVWFPPLQLACAILVGLTIGLGLVKFIKG